MKLIFYILLVMFAYRILKRLFLPAYGKTPNSSQSQQNPFQSFSSNSDKSQEIEDVDYEEIE